MPEPKIKPGPITISLTDDERTAAMAAVLTFAQYMESVPEQADLAWAVLSKLTGRNDVREIFSPRVPTRADVAKLLVDCEMQLAFERTQKAAQ